MFSILLSKVGSVSYAGAAIWQYETLRTVVKNMKLKIKSDMSDYFFGTKAGSGRQNVSIIVTITNKGYIF